MQDNESPAPKKILIVEDDPGTQDLMKLTLSVSGYEVSTAVSGAQALVAARRFPYDLILLDVMLPDIDGYHVAKTLSEELNKNCPPILMATARNTAKERGLALLSGAADVVQKPVAMDELERRVAKLLAHPTVP